jgi:hypothetical protein
LDLGWLCPIENRLYHMHYTELTQHEDIGLPDGFEIHCCRTAPSATKSRAVG